MTMNEDSNALSHLRVIELGGGPASYCAHFLAELGADVIKIEPPTGDPERKESPFFQDIEGRDRSLSFIYYNANKRGLVLDFEHQKDCQILLDLVPQADILLESFPPGFLDAKGIGYTDLNAKNPDLILVSLTPFGQTGPYKDFKGNNAIAEAMGGVIATLGDDNMSPSVSPNNMSTQVAALHGAYAALAASFNIRKGGTGQHIDISLQEIGTHMQTGLAEYGLRRNIRRRPGTGALGGTTSVYATKDDHIFFQPGQPNMWRALVEWMDDPVLSGPEWEDRDYRNENADIINLLVKDWIGTFTAEDFYWKAQENGIPTGPVNSIPQLVNSLQVEELDSFKERIHPEIGSYKQMNFLRFAASPIEFDKPAPMLGEHQDEIISSLASDTRDPKTTKRKNVKRTKPLEGLRILDFTRVIAGPTGTQFLGFLGADIIKVESAELPGLGREPAAGFPDMNRAKRSITLDARTDEGKELAFQLASKSDIVVNNFSAHVMDRLGLGYEAMSKIKPDIISISMPGIGRIGPLNNWVIYGQTLQAYTGLVYLWRHPESPLETGIKGPVADYVCAATLDLAILSAIEFRDRTGKGQFIDMIQLESLGHTLGPIYMDHMLNGRNIQPRGYQDDRFAPHGAYPCRGEDNWCVISCETEEEWGTFVNAIGSPGWANEERFSSKETRKRNKDALDALISDWTREYTRHQVMHILQQSGVPAGVIQDAEDLFYDYHLRARGHIVTPQHANPWGPFEHQGAPVKFSKTPSDGSLPTPFQGEHTNEVFSEILGLSPSELKRLTEQKILH
ncbi:MAG: CoA transferase [SAR202 cluster bacterium]|nr:CoA transferase [SAR202 cluster bacterium]